MILSPVIGVGVSSDDPKGSMLATKVLKEVNIMAQKRKEDKANIMSKEKTKSFLLVIIFGCGLAAVAAYFSGKKIF